MKIIGKSLCDELL